MTLDYLMMELNNPLRRVLSIESIIEPTRYRKTLCLILAGVFLL